MSQNYEIQEAYEKILTFLNEHTGKDENLKYRDDVMQAVNLYGAALVYSYTVCTKDIDNETCRDFVTAAHNLRLTHKLLADGVYALGGPIRAIIGRGLRYVDELYSFCFSILLGIVEPPSSGTAYRQLLVQAMKQPLGPYAAALVLLVSTWHAPIRVSKGTSMHEWCRRHKVNKPLFHDSVKGPHIVCGLGAILNAALDALGYSPYVLASLYKDAIRGNSFAHALKVVHDVLNADATSVITYPVLEHLADCLKLPTDALVEAAKASKVTLLPRASSEGKTEEEKQNQAFAYTLRLGRERKYMFQQDLIDGLAGAREARIQSHIDTAVAIAKKVVGNESVVSLSGLLNKELHCAGDYYSYMSCARSHLSHMETGKRVPNPALMAELASLLDLEPGKLFASSFRGAIERLQAAQADGKAGDLVGLINTLADQLDKGIPAWELENRLLK